MSILICGMKMPKIENYKSVKAEIRQIDGKFELGIMTGGYFCSQEWTYFPITEVPPHGRLIDADALRENIKESRKRQPEISDVYTDDYFIVANWLRSAPTIIEADGKGINATTKEDEI